jgi:hypothetical protein
MDVQQMILPTIAFFVAAYVIYIIIKKYMEGIDNVSDFVPGTDAALPEEKLIVDVPVAAAKEEVKPTESPEFAPASAPQAPAGDAIKPADLLPKSDAVASFEGQFPSGQGEASDKNFLIAGYNIGINTVGSSLKNANLQLRSDPYIPRKQVSIWNESTIMASDLTNRKNLEIGS